MVPAIQQRKINLSRRIVRGPSLKRYSFSDFAGCLTPAACFLMATIVKRADSQYAAQSNAGRVNTASDAYLKRVLQDVEWKVVLRYDPTPHHTTGRRH